MSVRIRSRLEEIIVPVAVFALVSIALVVIVFVVAMKL